MVMHKRHPIDRFAELHLRICLGKLIRMYTHAPEPIREQGVRMTDSRFLVMPDLNPDDPSNYKIRGINFLVVGYGLSRAVYYLNDLLLRRGGDYVVSLQGDPELSMLERVDMLVLRASS